VREEAPGDRATCAERPTCLVAIQSSPLTGQSSEVGRLISMKWMITAFWLEQEQARFEFARGTYAERGASKMALSNSCSIRKSYADQGFYEVGGTGIEPVTPAL
jgi:hypothetical protein